MLKSKSSPILTKLLIYGTFLIALLLPSTAPLLADSKEKFTVGLVLPLTGNAADYGMAIHNAINLAQEEHPELFQNIDFLYEDAIYDPKLAVAAYNKLISNPKVNLIATWGVSFCKPLAALAESKQHPLIGICIDPESSRNREFVIRFMNTTDDFMLKILQHLKAKKLNKLAFVLADHSYLEELLEAIKRQLLPGQNIEILNRYPLTEFDFRSDILKINQSDYDAIGVFLQAGQISNFYKQAEQLKLKQFTFGHNMFESLSEVEAGQGKMDGAVFSNVLIKADFEKRYYHKFGTNSQLSFGAVSYEMAMTIAKLFGKLTERPTAKEVIARLSSIQGDQGIASGPYRFVNSITAGKYFSFPVVNKAIKNSAFVNLDSAS